MPSWMIRSALFSFLSGLLLSACGGVVGDEAVPAEENLRTQRSALCAGLSVTSLTVEGISTFEGLMAGAGAYSVSTGAQGIRIEYYVDGALRNFDELVGSANEWHFSTDGISCGTHSFQMKAYPMVMDSAGNRTTCISNGTVSSTFNPTETCVIPSTTLSCSRVSSKTVRCTATTSVPATNSWAASVNSSWPAFSTGGLVSDWGCDTSCTPPSLQSEGAETPEVAQLGCRSFSAVYQFKASTGPGGESDVKRSETFTCFVSI